MEGEQNKKSDCRYSRSSKVAKQRHDSRRREVCAPPPLPGSPRPTTPVPAFFPWPSRCVAVFHFPQARLSGYTSTREPRRCEGTRERELLSRDQKDFVLRCTSPHTYTSRANASALRGPSLMLAAEVERTRTRGGGGPCAERGAERSRGR